MEQYSRQVSSSQAGLHTRLAETVLRHLQTEYRRPPATHSVTAYKPLAGELARNPRPLVLDSFCGTGKSTAALAQRHDGHLVIGVDQSGHRLGKHERQAGDYMLIRANCEDIWELLLRDGHRVQHHYLLYPNPWPKKKHLQRRVHGHASFSRLLMLGGTVELRSNWQLYVEEFGLAMHLAGRRGVVKQISGNPALTLFEEKYRRSGQALWRYFADTTP